MTITVTMSKEEFMDYMNFKNFKNQVKCGIIDLNTEVSNLMKIALEDGIWEDNNKYDKAFKSVNAVISKLERGAKDDNTNA